MSVNDISWSGGTTWRTETDDAIITTNVDLSDFYSATQVPFNGAVDPASGSGRPLLLTKLTLGFASGSSSSGSGNFFARRNIAAHPDQVGTNTFNGTTSDTNFDTSNSINDLDDSISREMELACYQQDVIYVGFKKTNGALTRITSDAESGYNVYIRYSNGNEPSNFLASDYRQTATLEFSTIPEAVSNLSASATTGGFSVSWNAPSDNGGSSVTGYRVSYSSDGGSTWTHSSSSSTSFSATVDDGTYTVRVAALNAVTEKHNEVFTAWSDDEQMTGVASETTVTVSSYDDPNFISTLSNRILYLGDDSGNFGDYIYATNTYSSLGLDVPNGKSNFTVSTSDSNYDSYFSINESSFSQSGQAAYLNWDIPSNATPKENLTVTVTAHNPSGTDTATATISIRIPLPAFTDDSLGNGRKGESYGTSTTNDSISADSNTESWIISGTPSGMTSSVSSNKQTVTFSGTPFVYGNQTITAIPRNSDNQGSGRNITFTINDIFPQWSDQTLSNTVVVQGDITYSDQVSVVNGPDVTYSVTPGYSLPTGLELNSTTGALTANSSTGITAEPNTYTFRIRATNGTNESIDTNDLNLIVEPAGGFMKVWNGASWVEAPAKVWNGSSWVEGTVKVWNGSAWVDSFSS